ncbi:MAG: hypothetical protein ACLFSV_06915, partial [Alkalispirochaeta sp.]
MPELRGTEQPPGDAEGRQGGRSCYPGGAAGDGANTGGRSFRGHRMRLGSGPGCHPLGALPERAGID